MINCTVTNYFNDAESHGAVKFIGDDCLITNCVLYGNANQLGESEEAQLILGGSGTQVVKNCDIQGLDAFAGNGNVDVDPDFVNAGGDDYRLAYTSLLLNNGDTSDLVADSFDIDDDSNTTEKVPARDMGLRQVNPATCVDMGAYENTVDNNNCPSDITSSGGVPDTNVNILDLLHVIAVWGTPGGAADIDPSPCGDATVDVDDLDAGDQCVGHVLDPGRFAAVAQ
jgi:hypothetical protein